MDSFLSNEQKSRLLKKLRTEKHRKRGDRLHALLLLNEGKPISEIATYLFLDEEKIRNYMERYKSKGLKKLGFR